MNESTHKCEECGAPAEQRFCCEACADAALYRVERKRRASELAKSLAESGLYSRTSRRMNFQRSSRSIEALNPAAWAKLRNWNASTNLYLCGPIGTGKTYAARCILAKAIQSLSRVSEIKAIDLFRVHHTFGREAEYERRTNTPYLLIDDIDKVARWTADRIECLWKTLDLRAEAGQRTILTANTPPGQIRNHITSETGQAAMVEAAFDRLLPVDVIEFKGQSQRGAR